MEILINKKTIDKNLKINMQVCYQNLDGVFCKLGTITDILLIDNVKNYLINTSFGSYLASELKLIKQ